MQHTMGTDKLPELQPEVKGTHQALQDVLEALPPGVTTISRDELSQFVHTKRVGSYLLGRTLGEGAFAKVKEALHVTTGEKVAVKVIDKRKARDDVYVHRNLRREARLLQMLHQRNIIQLLEVVETDNSYYLVTELCAGGELMDHICKNKRLNENEVRKYVRQIVLAVHHLHQAGIVHRDLKVENLLFDENMDIKIIDFGLSNTYGTPTPTNGFIVPTDHCHTQCGSPAYAAPELLGHKNYGPEVDVWSIGVNMYAMLTGSLPFTVEPFNISVLHAKMLDNKMNPIPERLSPNCKDLLLKLLTSKPEERISLPEVFNHPWLNEDLTVPFTPDSYPSRLSQSDLNESILQYMTETLRFCYSDVVAAVTSNKAVKAAAVYHLFVKRLQRHEKARRKEFAFQRPQVQQSPSRNGKKNCEHPPLERRTSGESKEQKPSNTGRRKRNHLSNCETNPPNPIVMDRLSFPTSSRRQSAPVSPSYAGAPSFGFGTEAGPPQSQGNSPMIFQRRSPPPLSRTPDIFPRRDKVQSSTSTQRSARRVQTAAGDIRREPIETKIPSTKDERKPRDSRRVSPPGVTRSPPNELKDEPLFERRRRSYTDGNARFPPAMRRHETYHGDLRRPGKYRTGPRPKSMMEAAEFIEHEDYKVLHQYQPNRAGSASIANRVIKTNALFPETESDLGAPVDLPAIAPPTVQTSARSRKNHTNKPFYETAAFDRNGILPSRSSAHHGSTGDEYLADNLQRLPLDLPAEAIVSEIIRVHISLGVEDIEQRGTHVVGRWNGVIFSTNVVPNSRIGHFVKFSRLSGDMFKYKEICDRVLAAINV